jgi:hypothetical protein
LLTKTAQRIALGVREDPIDLADQRVYRGTIFGRCAAQCPEQWEELAGLLFRHLLIGPLEPRDHRGRAYARVELPVRRRVPARASRGNHDDGEYGRSLPPGRGWLAHACLPHS